jgi:hypothetical protein
MRANMRTRVAAAVSVLIVSLVAGCGQTEEGAASPETGLPGPSTPTDGNSTTDSNAPGVVDPCSLLDQGELAQFGDFIGPEERTYQGYPVCAWHVEQDSASDVEAPMLDLAYRKDLGLEEVLDLGDGLQAGKLATGRELVKTTGIDPVTETPGCLVAMKVADGSRIDVSAGMTAEPCDLVEKVVEIVDPKLPRG